jgi:hypothetical protein
MAQWQGQGQGMYNAQGFATPQPYVELAQGKQVAKFTDEELEAVLARSDVDPTRVKVRKENEGPYYNLVPLYKTEVNDERIAQRDNPDFKIASAISVATLRAVQAQCSASNGDFALVEKNSGGFGFSCPLPRNVASADRTNTRGA